MIYSPKKYRETEGAKVRRLGYALDKATLQQIAYDRGITTSIDLMTQAQKAQLRYVAILQQSTNVMGDMARTIVTPANSMRILNQQITQFKRAVGNVFSVFAVKIIPYLQVAIRLLTDFANYLAELWGFELPTIDYSNVGQGLSAVEDDAEDATDAVKDTIKAVQRLAGFDEINVLKSAKDDANDAADALANNYDLGIDLPEYDFLQGVTNSTEELYQKVKAWLMEVYEWLKKNKTLVKTIAGIIAGIWVTNKLKPFITLISQIPKNFSSAKDGAENVVTKLGGLKSTLGNVISPLISGIGSYNLFYDLANNTKDWTDYLMDASIILGGSSFAWLFSGAKGLALSGVAVGIGAIIGSIKAAADAAKEADEALERLVNAEWYTGGGAKISDAANALSEYVSKISESESKVVDTARNIANLKSDIESVNNDISIMIASVGDAENVDISAVEKIKSAFDDLAKTTSSYISQNSDMLKTYIMSNSKLLDELGISADAVIKTIDGASGKTLSRYQEIQKEIDTILSKETLTDADLSKLDVLRNQYRSLVGLTADEETKHIEELKKSLESFASVPLNLQSTEDAKKNIDEMAKSVGTTLGTLTKAREEALTAINLLDFASEDERLNAINTINALYNAKELQLKDATKILEKYGGQINTVLDRIKQDYIDEAFGYDQNAYVRMLELQSKTSLSAFERFELQDLEETYNKGISKFQEYKSKLWKEYGSLFDDSQTYIAQQIALSSGLTSGAVQEFLANNMDHTKNLVKKSVKQIPLASSIKSLFSNAFSSTKSTLTNTTKSFTSSVLSALFGRDDMESAKNSVSSNFSSFWSAITGKNTEGATNAKNSLTGLIKSIFSGAAAGSQEAIKAAGDAVMANFAGAFSISFSTKSGLEQSAQSLVNQISASFMSSGNMLGGAFGKGFEDAVNEAMKSTLTSVANTIAETAVMASALGAMNVSGFTATSTSNPLIDLFRKLKIPGFASGGLVNGDLFLANENGRAEFISSIGNKPAVANQDQMRSEIRQGVKEGMLEALSKQTNGGDIYIYIDSDEVAAQIVRKNDANTKRTGGR